MVLTWVWLLSTCSLTHLLTQLSPGQHVRKEAKCVDTAIRPGPLRVRKALNTACQRKRQGGAKVGAVSQAPWTEGEGHATWGKRGGGGPHWQSDSVTWRDVQGPLESLRPFNPSWTRDSRGNMNQRNTLAISGRKDVHQRPHPKGPPLMKLWGNRHSYNQGEWTLGQPLWRGIWQYVTKLHVSFHFDILLRSCREAISPIRQKYTATKLFTAVLFVTAKYHKPSICL